MTQSIVSCLAKELSVHEKQVVAAVAPRQKTGIDQFLRLKLAVRYQAKTALKGCAIAPFSRIDFGRRIFNIFLSNVSSSFYVLHLY